MAWLAANMGTIFAANWAIVHFGAVPVGFGLRAPAGVYFASFALVARDVVQRQRGKAWSLGAVGAGTALTAVLSPALALASGAAFLFSELADFAVYTPLRARGFALAVAASCSVGLVIDSLLFLWLAFHSFDFLAGQVVGKAWVVAATVLLIRVWRIR